MDTYEVIPNPALLRGDEAQAWCLEQGATLAIIRNAQQRQRVIDACRPMITNETDDTDILYDGCYIGLERDVGTGPWRWIDGTPYDPDEIEVFVDTQSSLSGDTRTLMNFQNLNNIGVRGRGSYFGQFPSVCSTFGKC